MATLFLTEYAGSGRMAGDTVPVAMGRPILNNNVTIGGTHAESNAFSTNTKLIRLSTDAICSFVVGLAPVATTADARMAANQTEYFQVSPGDKLSVITNT